MTTPPKGLKQTNTTTSTGYVETAIPGLTVNWNDTSFASDGVWVNVPIHQPEIKNPPTQNHVNSKTWEFDKAGKPTIQSEGNSSFAPPPPQGHSSFDNWVPIAAGGGVLATILWILLTR